MADKKFLNEDGVSQFAEETKKYIDKHANNADIHVTANDKSVWNGKQDALTSQQLANIADVVNKANASDLTAHTNNADIHVTAADKANWNSKQDALTSQQLANIADVVNKANTSDLSAVATSGSYNDLSNKPTIPTVNNATLTIQKNGTNVQTFTANASSNVTANIVVPTKTSELTNDSGFLTTALPIGSYIQFAGSQAPDGFLVCNGGAISRTTYSKLFGVIGTTYGSGDGSTTFNLPNLTDRFLQGSNIVGTVKNAGLPDIEGYYHDARAAAVSSTATGAFIGSKSVQEPSDSGSYSAGGIGSNVFFKASNSNTIYGNSTTVQPSAITCLICIKY